MSKHLDIPVPGQGFTEFERSPVCTGGSKTEESPKDFFFEWLYVCVQLPRKTKNDIRRVICNK